VVLAGLAIVGCAPATASTASSATGTVELEVVLATNCEAGADMVATVDEVTHPFPTAEFERTGDPDLPLAATVSVPAPEGAATYRLTVTHRCDDSRRMSIMAFRVEGDDKVILSESSTTGRSPVVLDGTL
jgi:hypothetical protein